MTSIADYTLDERFRRRTCLLSGKGESRRENRRSRQQAQRNEALRAAASSLRAHIAEILNTNAADRKAARRRAGAESFIDRLTLNEARIEAMARGLDEIAALPDPVGEVIAAWTRPNGLKISRVRVPFGVIGIIYESRPNVTADAGGLCLKSGNAVILRGGSECFEQQPRHSRLPRRGPEGGGAARRQRSSSCRPRIAPRSAIMLEGLDGAIDVIVPRGGKEPRRPRAEGGARAGVRPSRRHLPRLCGSRRRTSSKARDHRAQRQDAAHRRFAARPRRCSLIDAAAPTACCSRSSRPCSRPAARSAAMTRHAPPIRAVKPATEEDWATEYLDAIISVKVVTGVDEAIDHIAHYGSHHTDSIVTEDSRHGRELSRARSTAPSCCTTPRRNSPMAANSAWARRSASPPAAPCARAGGRRAAHHLQICRARHRPDPALSIPIVTPKKDSKRPAQHLKVPMAAPNMRIGLLGGSFNPAHAAHRQISLAALKRLGLDQVWWLVSPGNPLKDARNAPDLKRASELRGRSPIIQRSWSPDSRSAARAPTPSISSASSNGIRSVDFVWLMGADNLVSFHRWRAWEELFGLVPIAVLDRPGYRLKARASRAAQRFAFAALDEFDARGLASIEPPACTLPSPPLSSLSSTRLRGGMEGESPCGKTRKAPKAVKKLAKKARKTAKQQKK